MFEGEFKIGDLVGVKDSPEFTHWSRQGRIVSYLPGEPGIVPPSIQVSLDGGTDATEVMPALIVKLGPDGATDPWSAQAFPLNGDAPGQTMYFANFADVLAFVRQFQSLELDETLKVHVPAGGMDADRQAIRQAGAVPD